MPRHNRRTQPNVRPIPPGLGAQINGNLAYEAQAQRMALAAAQADWAIGRPIEDWNGLVRSLGRGRIGIQVERLVHSGLVMVTPGDFQHRYGSDPITDVPNFTSSLNGLQVPNGNKKHFLAHGLQLKLGQLGVENIAGKLALTAGVAGIDKISTQLKNLGSYDLDAEVNAITGFTKADCKPMLVFGVLVLPERMKIADALGALVGAMPSAVRVGRLSLLRGLPDRFSQY